MIGRMAAPPALDAPVVGLGDTEALAKEWLLELIGSRPLGEAVRVSTDRMAADGPALVAAVVAALVSDRELERLAADGEKAALAAAAGAIAGAGGPAEVVAALELHADLRPRGVDPVAMPNETIVSHDEHEHDQNDNHDHDDSYDHCNTPVGRSAGAEAGNQCTTRPAAKWVRRRSIPRATASSRRSWSRGEVLAITVRP